MDETYWQRIKQHNGISRTVCHDFLEEDKGYRLGSEREKPLIIDEGYPELYLPVFSVLFTLETNLDHYLCAPSRPRHLVKSKLTMPCHE